MATLSELLTLQVDFNFFKSVANLEPYNLSNIITCIEELLDYVNVLLAIFTELQDTIDANPKIFTLDWYCEGRAKFNDLYRNVDSIDSLLLQIINVVNPHIESDPQIGESQIFLGIDELTESCLLLKQQYLISFKSKIDLATEYEEFNNMLNSINSEMENCLKLCIDIHEKRSTVISSNTITSTFDLKTLTKKLFNQKSNLRLPLLDSLDEEIYQEYQYLTDTMAPLRASLQLIPSRFEDFKSKYSYFSHDSEQLIDIGSIELRYRALLDDLEYLNEESKELKNEIVCKKWDQIFGYLNCETAGMIGLIEKELASDSDSAATTTTTDLELIRSTALTVQNTFDLLHIAIDEDLVDIKVMERSNELALLWLELRNKIPHSYLENAPQQDSEDDSLELIQNLKQLSLEKPAAVSAPPTTAQEMSKKEKRRSRAGEFFMGKLNIIPVLIADDSDSSKKPTPRNSGNLSKDSIFNRSPELIQEGFQTKQKRNSAVPLLIEQFAREELQLMETAIAETRTPIGSEKIIKIKDIAKEDADVFVSPNLDNSVKPRELPAYKVPDSPGPIRIQRSAAVQLDTSLYESRPSRIPRPISKAASVRLEFRPKSSSSSSASSSAPLKKSSPSITLNDIITSTTKFIPRPTSSLEAHFHSLSGANPSSRFTALSSSDSYKHVDDLDDETF